jgi:hypothetical protein
MTEVCTDCDVAVVAWVVVCVADAPAVPGEVEAPLLVRFPARAVRPGTTSARTANAMRRLRMRPAVD